jgi:CRISPR-associated endoribonuclease Cas6
MGSTLPVHYNGLVQGWIYRHLESSLARKVHLEGWQDGKRQIRFFTFSRLLGDVRVRNGRIRFLDDVRLVLASPLEEFLEDLALALMREGTVCLGDVDFEVTSVEVRHYPELHGPLFLKAVSPITVYSTFETPDGRKKTYYYAPQEPDFEQQVLANLRRKVRAWAGEDIPEDGATFSPYRVSTRNLSIVKYKGTVIKGWTGIYRLDAPESYLRMALDAGLGAKNSQGFGCVEVWEPRKKSITRRHGEHGG